MLDVDVENALKGIIYKLDQNLPTQQHDLPPALHTTLPTSDMSLRAEHSRLEGAAKRSREFEVGKRIESEVYPENIQYLPRFSGDTSRLTYRERKAAVQGG